jgi:hydroxysqualene synthase
MRDMLTVSTEELTSRSWSVEEAQAYCTRLATEHYENFPVGSAFIPRELRPHVHAIYAFARTADDYADESDVVEGLRLPLLENWEAQLLQSVWRNPQHPVFIALKETMARFELPVDLFRDLITAFKLDVVRKRYATFQDVLFYCRHSANPIGRLVLLLFGVRDPDHYKLSDSICTALQLANFWQDVRVDLEKDRIYIPLKDMERFGYSEVDLVAHRYNDSFRELIRFQVDRTRSLFEEGRPLCSVVDRSLRFELNLVWRGGMHILELLEARGFNMFAHRPVLTSTTWAWLGAKAFWSSRFSP